MRFAVSNRIVNIWLFTSGFVALGYEILWVRTVVHFLQAEIYVFSSILCVYLIGYALGVYAGSRLVRIVSNHFVIFGILLQLLGLTGVLYLPALTTVYRSHTTLLFPATLFFVKHGGIFLPLFYSFLLFFLPSVIMGLGYPFLIQMKRTHGSGTGDTVARAYSITTTGNVLGSLVTGFVLIPLIGSQASMHLLSIIALMAGLLAIPFYSAVFRRLIPAAGFLAGLVIVFASPRDGLLKLINTCEGKNLHPTKLLEVLEGLNTTASVHYYEDLKGKVISTAGFNVAGDMLHLRQTQKAQGHIPLIFHGNPRKVLTVGFGSGELTRVLTLHDIPDITCVEISPEIVELAIRHFSHINLGADLEKKVRMIYMDAKNYMHLADTEYDVIMNDAIWPGWFAESSSLYTKEYFMEGKEMLREEGLYSSWLPVNVPSRSLKSILRTFDEVFENTLVLYPHHTVSQHLLLIGQKKAHKYSYPAMKREYGKNDRIRESLGLIGVRGVDDVIDFILTSSPSLRKFTGDVPVNSDYNPVVEYDPGRQKNRYNPIFHWDQLRSIYRETRRVDYTELLRFKGVDLAEIQETMMELVLNQRANEFLFRAIFSPNDRQRVMAIEQGLRIDPDNPDLLNWRNIVRPNP